MANFADLNILDLHILSRRLFSLCARVDVYLISLQRVP